MPKKIDAPSVVAAILDNKPVYTEQQMVEKVQSFWRLHCLPVMSDYQERIKDLSEKLKFAELKLNALRYTQDEGINEAIGRTLKSMGKSSAKKSRPRSKPKRRGQQKRKRR